MISTATPARSDVQRLHALQKANTIRVTRAAKKRQIRTLDRDEAFAEVAGLIMRPPSSMLTMKVHELLLQVPKWGQVKVDRLLMVERISPSKTLGGLSERQRVALVVRLRGAGQVAA